MGIGESGQIAPGKEYTGRIAVLDEIEPGVWILKLGTFVPDSERRLRTREMNESLDRAIAWTMEQKPSETDVDTLERAYLATESRKSAR